MAQRVLVTGGTGVNGAFVIRELLNEGFEPVVFELHPDFTLLKDIRSSIQVLTGDIRDLRSLVRALGQLQVSSVIHMAALVQFPLIQADPYLGFEVNAVGTVNVLEAATLCNVKRVVFTSSKGVYGEVKDEYAHPTYHPLPEEYLGRPDSVYGIAKLTSEVMGLNYHRGYGLDFIALRFASIYGPGKLSRHGSFSLHSKLIENAISGKPTRIPQGADQKDDMVYVKDVAQGIVKALKADHVRYGVFNIGTGVGRTLVDMAQVVKEFFPNADIQIGPGLDYMGIGISGYSVLDITRAREQLGYQPQFDLRAGVADYLTVMDRFGIRPA